MTDCDKRIQPVIATVLVLLCLFRGYAQAAADESLQQISLLDEKYQQLMTAYYESIPGDPPLIVDFDQLLSRVESTRETQHPLDAIRLLASHLDYLAQSAEHPAIVPLTEFLLEHNQSRLVEQIYRLVEDAGDDTNQAYIDYHLARYFSRLNQWQAVIDRLENSFSYLSGDDSDYATLLRGGALQYLRKHRLAMESYARIPADSKYFIHAQLNTAIASIRQGWVTEARLTLKNILPVAKSGDPEMANRIYLVLGYALLNKEYYRDARDAFRQITRDSRYTNKALLGIALTAISQGDYVGGLNMLNRLKAAPRRDLSADEAYLLLPHVYQRLNQNNSVAASFQEAIDYYQTRLLELNRVRRAATRYEEIELEAHSGDILLGEIRLPFSQHYPFYLLVNRNHLFYLKSRNNPRSINAAVDRLLPDYDAVLKRVLGDIFEKRKKLYTSYLNQSRYGLARHYDETREGAQ